jgi:hypothetical protein
MKKTIAKLMAAVMLAASMPAMVMPTFTVEASGQNAKSITTVKFNGTYQNGKVLSSFDSAATKYSNADNRNLIVKTAMGMEQTGVGVWNTHIQYFTDSVTGATAPQNKAAAITLAAGSVKIGKEDGVNKAKDYFDNTGVIKEAKLDSNGELILTIDQSKLTDAKLKEFAAGTNNTVEFYPFTYVQGTDLAPVFTIQIGETFTAKKTQLTGCSTPDNFIKDATVVLGADNTATLIKVSDNDKKVLMKGQKIEVSEIEVGGISYPIRKFEEQCLKSAKMKRLTAKNVKNLETGCVRGCKRLNRVTMGNTKIKKIHSNAFYDCEKLKNIKINAKNLKSVGSKAFYKLKNGCTISIKAGSNKKYKEVVKKIKKSKVGKVKFKKA